MVVRVYRIEWGPARSCLAMAGGLMRMRVIPARHREAQARQAGM